MADDERTNNTQASANQEQSREPVVDVEDIDVKKIETKRRDLHGWQWWIVAGIAISASAFHCTPLYRMCGQYQRSTMDLWGPLYCCTRFPKSTKGQKILDGAFAIFCDRILISC